MPENENTQDQGQAVEVSQADFAPIASQADLDRIIQNRLTRERARYADYEDLKAKAAKFDEIEAANQTELEKTQAANKELAAKLAAAELAANQAQVAAAKGLPAEMAERLKGSTLEELEADADALAKLMQPAANGKPGLLLPDAQPNPINSGDGFDYAAFFGV